VISTSSKNPASATRGFSFHEKIGLAWGTVFFGTQIVRQPAQYFTDLLARYEVAVAAGAGVVAAGLVSAVADVSALGVASADEEVSEAVAAAFPAPA